MVSIPIGGSASSLNAATAAGILLYEAARQRSAVRRPEPGPAPDPAGPW
jgi:TrmH family RNA methyltransferase